MAIFQGENPIGRGVNFIPQRRRYTLPKETTNNSVYLLSNSFEYDIELIRNIPQPKMVYKTIIIPYKVSIPVKLESSSTQKILYACTSEQYNKKVSYMNSRKLNPALTALKYPYNSIIKENLYISMSDIFKQTTPIFRNTDPDELAEKVFTIFDNTLKAFNYSQNKILIVDTRRVHIVKNPMMSTIKHDLLNALLASCVLYPDKVKKIDVTIIFRSPEYDYKFDLKQFEKRDLGRLKQMIMNIGSTSALVDEKPAESLEEIDSEMETKNLTEELKEEEKNEKKEEVDDTTKDSNVDVEVKNIQNANNAENAISNINDTISILSSDYGTDTTMPKQKSDEDRLYDIKVMDIDSSLIQKINPSSEVVANYKRLSKEMSSLATDSVEEHIMKATAKNLSGEVTPADQVTAVNAVSSERERAIREKIGKVKLNNVTFDTLTSITDVPKPAPIKVRKITTTNTGALQGTSFPIISQEYEEKLLDRDIVATFMNFSKLPDGFYVTDVKVTDISTVTSLMNNWRVTLKNRLNDRQSIINIRVPKVVNGRFYNNGIWYNIGKQDFPIPILKINKRTVMLTSNYNKITCERYDTRSLVDLGMLFKIIDKRTDENGKNPFVKMGSSVSTNSRFVSTIEYDEFARKWLYFVNRDAKLEILFNRVQCQKNYAFVSVKPNEFCCGMINQVPIVINTDTGKTRTDESITDIILKTLPADMQTEYHKQKPGKLSMYSQITIGVTMPLGVAIAAWEGISSLLKRSGAEYRFVDKSFSDMHYFVIEFKDKRLAIQSTIQNQLLFNGFYRLNTKGFMFSDFETPIMRSNSIYVDIFNQLFFKQYSQLTAFITYYNFFVDAITADVCRHYHIPDDIASMLIYASNLLADNNHTSENNASLYRIRSSEIIPAIIHYRLALAISKYNNNLGSKARGNAITFNPNEIINSLLTDVPNVEAMSALNPMVELHMRENITKKGFKGVNSDRSYTEEKRTYDESMVGKMALSSPNNANVGMNRQLVADPKIESVRGYTSTAGVDTNFNDLQLSSFSELLTPSTVSRDDAVRTAIATSQTSHIVSTEGAQPALISNGVDELVPAYLTEEFSYVAREDGKVLDMNEDYMIIQYKSGKKKAVHIGQKQSFNSGSGFYVDNKLTTNFQVNDSFKQGDVLAYHEKFFSKDNDGVVRINLGPLAKVAFAGLYSTYEDAGLVTHKMSKLLETKLSMCETVKLDATDDIEKIVKVGDEVEIGDPLVVFGLGDTGDKSVDSFLKAFQSSTGNDVLDNAKRVIRAKHAGKIVDVRMYTTKSMDRLSPSLFDLLDEHFKHNLQRKKILDKYDKTDSPYKMDTMFTLPTAPLKGTTIKGITCDVLIEIYIEHADEASVGDKLTVYAASKQVLSEVVPVGQEPFSEDRPDEEISIFTSPRSILGRMVPSIMLIAAGNKCLVELKRQIKDIWEKG